MLKKLFAIALTIGALVTLAPVAPANAETLQWTFVNRTGSAVHIEFTSQGRSAAWPGNNRAWRIESGDTREFTLNCWSGENICYGAWPMNGTPVHWGSGNNNRYSCSSCCSVCNGGFVNTIPLDD